MRRHVNQQTEAGAKEFSLDGFDPRKIMDWWFWATKSEEQLIKENKLMEEGIKQLAKLLIDLKRFHSVAGVSGNIRAF